MSSLRRIIGQSLGAPASLRVKLGLAAALLGLIALLAALVVIVGMARVGDRIDASLAAEKRIDRYATLSTQISRFLVVATEAIQSGLSPSERTERLSNLSSDVEDTLQRIRQDLEQAVAETERLGIDEQSRRATQSLAIARMEAHFRTTRDALLSGEAGRERLQGFVDTFAIGFDPLLNTAIIGEVRARDAVIAGIAELRRNLTLLAVAMATLAVLLAAIVYLGLVRPQFRRLDDLRSAARQIGRQDFAVSLPEQQRDEIGGLFAETNRMAAALSDRKEEVAAEWARLNETIDERTKELRAANEALARADEERRRFFADVSHELRTPLTVILMEAQLAQKGNADPQAAFETIEGRALRLNRRIDDLLRVARSESGRLELEAEPFELNQVVADAVDESRAAADSAGMELAFAPGSSFTGLGDANWTRQIVENLILNAVRHARSGRKIRVEVEVRDAEACVHVTDNGVGIPANEQEAVLERFAQGAGSARSEGFGIGLALAKWIIERQGGRLELTSPVPGEFRLGDGAGTRATLCIPSALE